MAYAMVFLASYAKLRNMDWIINELLFYGDYGYYNSDLLTQQI